MQDGAAFLNPLVVAATNNLAIVHDHASDRDPALRKAFTGLVDRGIHEFGVAHISFYWSTADSSFDSKRSLVDQHIAWRRHHRSQSGHTRELLCFLVKVRLLIKMS
mmetsp:Transcript_5118/g.7864  ORF Transcript_5118/g.7864 Transcript_5118/m.7864 type:complete len:106 (-) Transcript_5118:118-435(-)